MSALLDHTAVCTDAQLPGLLDEAWTTEIVPSLPPNLTSQAYTLGAFRRTRAFAAPPDLLRGLLAYVLCAPAFRQLGIWGVLAEVAAISDTAWRKRLQRASAWLLWLVRELLPATPAPTWLSQRLRGRIWLVDASTLAQSGGKGDAWRLHLGYDLLAGRIGQVTVTDRLGGETLEHFGFQAEDVVVADAGYGYRRMLATAQARHTDVVFRMTPSTFPLERSTGTPLDLVAWLRCGGPAVRSLQAYCNWAGQRYGVRVIAVKLNEIQQRSAVHRVRRKAAQHHREARDTTLFLAGWLLVVTTLDAGTWTDAEVVTLYRARWQIELLFKRIKQLLRLHTLRAHTAVTAEATVRAALVAWALQERENQALLQRLRGLSAPVTDLANWRWSSDDTLSVWTLSAVTLEVLRQQVRGRWTAAHLQARMAQLRRFLASHPRHRGHQATDIWSWLTGVCFRPTTVLQDSGDTSYDS